MHPAYSVILFTTASGAGYGLLALLCLGIGLGLLPADAATGWLGFGPGLALVTCGLLSSTFHLGRPERAWRAFSQWRSSWLSREGVLAVATYLPTGLLALGLVAGLPPGPTIGLLLGLAGAALALATVLATGMIYATLATIRQWHQPLTTPVYLALALATGGVLLNGLLLLRGADNTGAAWLAAAATAVALGLKLAYWQAIDGAPRTLTAESATGLGHLGRVRPLDPPHTQPNYVMREMGYRVARQHAGKLRRWAAILLFLVPIGALLVSLAPVPVLAPLAGLAAVLSAGLGVVVERWLFFAEAEHVAMLYYGAERA